MGRGEFFVSLKMTPKEKHSGARQMRGSLQCAADDEAVRRFGRDNGFQAGESR